MVDPGWDIWGKCPPPPLSPCGGTIFLIKILNFVRPRSTYKTHETMHFLLAFIAKLPEIKAKQNYEIVTQHLCGY